MVKQTRITFGLEDVKDIEQSVKDLLNDPGFYKKDKITAHRALSEAREDGSR